MLKINIVAVGTIKDKGMLDSFNEFKKRAFRFCEVRVFEVEEESKQNSTQKKIEKESLKLQNACKGTIILLDRVGKLVSSEDLANILSSEAVEGASEITFVVGGSNGVDNMIKSKAKHVVSFGKITFPHGLFRVVLMEQVYRAFTINNNLPYHK